MCRSLLVERMPVLDEATYSGRRAGSLSATIPTSNGAAINLPNGVAKPTAAPLVDLLDLSSDDAPAPSSSGSGFLHDLLGVDLSPSPSQSGWLKDVLVHNYGVHSCETFITYHFVSFRINNLFAMFELLIQRPSLPEKSWRL